MIVGNGNKQLECFEKTTTDSAPNRHNFWEEVLAKRGNLWCNVHSNSMRPLMYRGDAILVQNFGFNKVRRGDIVVFKKDKYWVTHRIIGYKKNKNRDYYIEKGDANLDATCIDAASIIGKVQKIRNYQGIHDFSKRRFRICRFLLTGLSLTALNLWAVITNPRLFKINKREWRKLANVYSGVFTLFRLLIIRVFCIGTDTEEKNVLRGLVE